MSVMLSSFMYIFEIRKDVVVGLSVAILYITYYLVEAVKKPLLVCRAGPFRSLLERRVGLVCTRYWPTPWCVEARLQTVLGTALRSLLQPPLPYRREVVPLADGGQVALDWVEDTLGAGEVRAVVVVLPGLAGGVQADYVRCIAGAAHSLGARCAVVCQRGLGGLELRSARLYCAVSHEDAAAALHAASKSADGAPLLAVGVSLGGLILGHYLAEQGTRALVQAALVISSPLDVVKGSESMESGLNSLLSRHMAGRLVYTVRKHSVLEDWARRPNVVRARSVREFDAAFTAPHFGFESVDAYYRAASLRGKLSGVRVPMLCLCAADDPFQPEAALPLREAEAAGIAMCVPARGGHIAFLEGLWPARDPHQQYVARLTRQYFGALLDEPQHMHHPPADQAL